MQPNGSRDCVGATFRAVIAAELPCTASRGSTGSHGVLICPCAARAAWVNCTPNAAANRSPGSHRHPAFASTAQTFFQLVRLPLSVRLGASGDRVARSAADGRSQDSRSSRF